MTPRFKPKRRMLKQPYALEQADLLETIVTDWERQRYLAGLKRTYYTFGDNLGYRSCPAYLKVMRDVHKAVQNED